MFRYLVLLGAVINIAGSFSYIKDTLRGTTKPNRVTWLLWSVAPFIATIAAFVNGVTWAVIPVFMSGFCPFLIFLGSFVNPNAYWKLGLLDYICGFFSILALILWITTKNPLIAIVFAIISDACAALPTIIKSLKHPETESGIAYLTGLISALTGLAAIKAWIFPEYGFTIYLITLCSFISFLVYRRKLCAFIERKNLSF
jgi:hypothetical protein